MKTALFILTVYVLGESLAVIMVDDIIYEGDRDKCPCCLPPCCCKCAKRETEPVTQTLPPSTTPPATTSTTGVIECNNTLDICFVVDSSGSIGSENWEVAKQFIIDVTDGFTIGRFETRVAMITYSTNATLNWNLAGTETRNRNALENAIRAISLMGAFTNTVEGMEVAVEQVFGKRGDRKDTPNACVVITDGRSNYRPFEVEEMANRLQAKTPVIGIGVTSEINKTELSVIASGDGMTNVYTVDSFDDLSEILQGLVKTVCEEVPTGPPGFTKIPRTSPKSIPGKVEEQCICCCPPMTFGYGWGDGCPCDGEGYGYGAKPTKP